MAHERPDFDLVWAANRPGGIPADTITNENYQLGWQYRAGVPPLTINFDYYQNLNDLRVTWLAEQLPTTGVSDFVKTLLDDPNDATFRASIGANNASNLNAGTLSNARTAAFTGDVAKPAGSGVLTLSNTGVGAGTYGTSTSIPRITVDAKGRITSISLQSISIPSSSEGTAGVVAEASQAEIDAGSNVSKYVAPDKMRWGFEISLGTNPAYVKFPSWLGGYIRAWGSINAPGNFNSTVNLSAIFPAAVRGVSATLSTTANTDQRPPRANPSGRNIAIRNPDSNAATIYYTADGN